MAGLAGLLLLALLALQLITIERQRRIAVRQEQRVLALLEAARPQAQRLRSEADELIPAVTMGLRRADDLVQAFAAQDVPAAIAAAGELAVDLTTGDRARILADRGNQLLAQLQSGDTLGDVQVTSQSVLELVGITGDLRAITANTAEDVDTLTNATVPFVNESLGVQRQLLGIGQLTLESLQQTLDTLEQSLAIQQETLERVRAIEERTDVLVPEPLDPGR